MQMVLESIREQLHTWSSEKGKKKTAYYFKSDIKTFGVKAPLIHGLSVEIYESLKTEDRLTIYDICTQLMATGYIEEAIIAADIAFYMRKDYVVEDFEIFQKWVEENIDNWATCDSLCTRAIGSFLLKYPDYIHRLDTWAKSENLWMRRAAAVSLILPSRKNIYFAKCIQLADILRNDEEDMVQKGYGWMLKGYSKHREKEVFEYVMTHKNTMPRTALRYAIEKMPLDLRKLAMAK
ncbi:DNA alkylation repair protein [Membranihabitans marinus]|uniref:DNA alkylation repair protein n=1 Tax=Membranihabitans marinus TaxID=1227546 RepID=UPI001F3B6B44|nr:DNA alkylation repair protein [Membranihabitans marinus]